MEDIHSEYDLDRLVGETKGYVLLDLWAAWCRPCQVMMPALQTVEELFHGKLSVCRLEVDEQEEMAEAFCVSGIPTFILYKEGKEMGRIIGYRQKAKFIEELEKIMDSE